MKHRAIILAMLPALLISGCSGGFGNASNEKIAVVAVEKLPEYNVEQVRLGNIESSTTIYFKYKQAGTSEYSFEKAGQLGEVKFKSGDVVNTGDVIATLSGYDTAKSDYEKYTGELEKKQEKLDTLKSELEYALKEDEIRHKYGYMSDSDFDAKSKEIHAEYDDSIKTLEDEISILELRISTAKDIYEGGAIIAKAGGTISNIRNVFKSNNKGNNNQEWWNWMVEDQGNQEDEDAESKLARYNHVEAGETICTVADNGEIAFVCETEYADHFSAGQAIDLMNGEKVYHTKVTSLTENTVTLTPSNAEEGMYVGMQINYSLVLEKKEAVNVISKSSLHVSGDDYYVYVVGDDNLRQMRKVQIGLSNSADVEIVSGLEAGDLVVKR